MMPMTDSSGYAVQLLDDDNAWLRAAIERLLPPSAWRKNSQTEDSTIGLVSWVSATTEEISALAQLRARHEGPLVAVLAEWPNPRGARVIAARLQGSVLASEIDRTLRPTLDAVAVGQCVVPATVRQLADRPPLSPRERQMLAMIVLDFSNAEIARKLFVTESNVKNHLSSAFQKLGVKSRSAAAALILDPESGLGPGILRISADESLPGLSEIN
jgi:DNA-binding NarL/FixJ family response regulator